MATPQKKGSMIDPSFAEIHDSVVSHFKKNTGDTALIALLTLALVVTSAGYSPKTDAATAKPNFVVIMTDDMPYSMLAAMPYTKSLIAAQGTSFNRAYVETALCCPSRSTFLTGLYAHNHGVFTNSTTDGGYKEFKANGLENKTFVLPLQAAGYQTSIFGKYLNNYSGTIIPKGWNRWFVSTSNFKDGYNWGANDQGVIRKYGTTSASFTTDVLLKNALQYMKQNASSTKPFFMFFSVSSPHEPAPAATRHAGLFATATVARTPSFNEADMSDKPTFLQIYPELTPAEVAIRDQHYGDALRSLQSTDEAVKAIIDQLKSSGKLANTFVIFTSDHGSHFGEHRAPEGKQLPYEEDIRVPLLVRGPGVRVNYVDNEHLVVNADWAPTILRLAGLNASSTIDGRSMRPLIVQNVALDQPWRSVFPLARWRADTDNLAPYPDFRGVKTARYTYVEWANGEKELYDLVNDPYEINNVASSTSYATAEASLAALNAALQTCAGPTCRELERQVVPQ